MIFAVKMSKNAEILDKVQLDWTGIKPETFKLFSHSEKSKYDYKYFPFGDVVVLDANITQKGGIDIIGSNSCPKGWENLAMQDWEGMHVGCDCR